MADNYIELFNSSVRVSDRISSLYRQLAFIEHRMGVDTSEYKQILNYIRQYEAIEKRYLDYFYSDSSVLHIFSELLASSDCERLKTKLDSEYYYVDKMLVSNINEEYDELLEKYAFNASRQTFVDNHYEESYREVLMPCLFKLIEKKKLLTLIDYYLEESKSEEDRRRLISEKYLILSSNSSLESWYFGYGDDISCLLADVDSVGADSFRMPLDKYLTQKNEYFTYACDRITKKALDIDFSIHNLRIVYESFLMAELLNMDLNSLNGSYRVFRNATSGDKYDNTNVEFIDSVYSKYSTLAKRFNK